VPCAAPTWADTDSAFGAAAGPGVALDPADELGVDHLAAGGLAGDDLADLSDDDVAAWAARFADEQAVAPEELPVPAAGAEPDEGTASLPETDAGSAPDGGVSRPDGGVSRTARAAAGRTRAAAARTRKSARRKVRTRRRVVVAGVCVPAIAVVAAMALQHSSGRAHTTAGAPAADAVHAAPAAAGAGAAGAHTASAGSPASQQAQSLGTWQHIATRAGDPSPLTLSQLFPAQFAVGGASYLRTAQLGSTHCSRGVFGASLQGAVRKYGCSQVMRASYLVSSLKLMGTIGVLNLANAADANKVGRVTGSSEFIAQLTAATGPTRTLTRGTGLEEAEVKGHYLILTWVEFTTHRAPGTAAQRAQLRAFSADLISQTANVSLTSRMVTGAPQIP
jgi:hypothetical protein